MIVENETQPLENNDTESVQSKAFAKNVNNHVFIRQTESIIKNQQTISLNDKPIISPEFLLSPDQREIYYSEVINLQVEELYKAQAYFNLGYMHQYGLGTAQDLNKSWIFYNQTYHHNKYALFSVKISQFLLGFQESEGLFNRFEAWSPSVRDFYAALIGFGVLVWLTVEVLRVRQRNLIESFNIKME